MDWSLIEPSIGAAATAVGYALAVYFSRTGEEKWSFVKAGKTATLAGVVAFIGTYKGISGDVITTSPFYAFLGIMLERTLKILERKIIPETKKIIRR